ncbi:hypothetical protein L6164_011327 [Bauhinia variegata]|uniref:Uncharacterized protein n=1 Tax=Bauhinia variegata TaxID=167791 RepID=A0ACB9P5J5_BAUVA|nr:hypothetical protein L6164_011327 [Bauhinia variegata]
MVTETLNVSRLTNGEAENSLHKQTDEVPSKGFIGKRENVLSDGTNGTLCNDGNLGEVSNSPEAKSQSDAVSKRARQQKEVTLEDMYNNQDLFDEDDDDDSDWEPLQNRVELIKWFCRNCTMVNLDDVVYCDICGEHKDSKILSYGFFASPFAEEMDTPEVESITKERQKDVGSKDSVTNGSTAIGFDERMLLHAEVEMKSHPHPERPDRLRAIAASFARAGIFPGRCYPITAREITPEELQMVHTLEHIEAVEITSQLISSYFTPDTYANEHSARAARLAAGLCADLASSIVSGRAKNGFALVRPPGHHAGVKQAMGFCLHNNAAVAALAAQVAGARKILIVDWDVHHGNGTQEIFDSNKSVLYISLHRHEGGRFYPGTGAADEVGTMGAEGYCVNIPWSRGGVGDNDYIFSFKHVVLPIATKFAPDLTIISAGFDAARGDPLGCCDVTPNGYAQMTHMLNTLSDGKLLVILEGGYNLRSISSSATAVIKVLLGDNPGFELENSFPSRAGLQTVMDVLEIQMKFWPALQPTLMDLRSQWGIYCLDNKRRQMKKKRRRFVAPIWWKWGPKSSLYRFLNRRVKSK